MICTLLVVADGVLVGLVPLEGKSVGRIKEPKIRNLGISFPFVAFCTPQLTLDCNPNPAPFVLLGRSQEGDLIQCLYAVEINLGKEWSVSGLSH